MLHQIKIKQCYLLHILEGRKTFEIRKNDRNYQVGDIIKFLPIEQEENNIYGFYPPVPKYEITYILSDFVGLQKDYVCLSIKPIQTGINSCAKENEGDK